jgi:hypothetical protein
VIQRFASGLRLNVHLHTLLPDGVFYENNAGALRFHELPAPSDDDIAQLVATVRRRVLRLLERRGHKLPRSVHDGAEHDDSDDSEILLRSPNPPSPCSSALPYAAASRSVHTQAPWWRA